MPRKQLRAMIGGRLRQARTGAKLTQEDVASELHLTRQSVSAWESGRTMPSIEELRDLSIRYGVSTDMLIHGVQNVTEAGELLLARVRAGCKHAANCARKLEYSA